MNRANPGTICAVAFHTKARALLPGASLTRISHIVGEIRQNYSSSVQGRRPISIDKVLQWVAAWNAHPETTLQLRVVLQPPFDPQIELGYATRRHPDVNTVATHSGTR